MVTGLGFGDRNLAICEGVPCCLMKMAPTLPTHTHTMKHKQGTKDIARFCEVHHLDLHHDILTPPPSLSPPLPFCYVVFPRFPRA